jgi:hypothetical protein
VMSNLCYEQREDLTRVGVVFHNKNFLHWIFPKSVVPDPTGLTLWLKYSAIPRCMPRLFRHRSILAITTRTSKNPATMDKGTSK